MHADQVDVTVGVVAELVAGQFPQWRHLPVRPVASDGTVNALFRLGDGIVLRLPLQSTPRDELVAEAEIARRIAPHVPFEVPTPLAIGEPGAGYPFPWAAYRWIPGVTASAGIGEPGMFARDLAGFVTALRGIDTGGRGWGRDGRGRPLPTQDRYVRSALAASTHLTDTAGLARIWDECLAGAGEDVTPVWVHADLMPGNLLLRDGRLAAVIDLGTVTVGDPAVDLMPAWNLLPPGSRETYRHAVGADDATWRRGRGWALVQAIVALPYYLDTNPAMAATARHTLDAILA